MPKLNPYEMRDRDRHREEVVADCWRAMREDGWPPAVCAEIERVRIERQAQKNREVR